MKVLLATLCATCLAATPALACGHEFLGTNAYYKGPVYTGSSCGNCCGAGATVEGGGLSCINTAFPAWVFCGLGIVGGIAVVWFIIMWVMYAMRKWKNPNPT